MRSGQPQGLPEAPPCPGAPGSAAEEKRDGTFSMGMRNSTLEDPKYNGTFPWIRSSALEEHQDGQSFLSWMKTAVMEDSKDEEPRIAGAQREPQRGCDLLDMDEGMLEEPKDSGISST